MMNSLLAVGWPINSRGKPAFQFLLEKEESAAIGCALVQWAFLEEMLFHTTNKVCSDIGEPLPVNANQHSFRKRLKVIRDLMPLVEEGEAKASLLKTLARIANLNGTRQKLVHGIWEFDPSDPSGLLVAKPSRESDSRTRMSAEAIFEFARKIGEASFSLTYPLGLSMQDFVVQRGNAISRLGWQLLRGQRELPPLDDAEPNPE